MCRESAFSPAHGCCWPWANTCWSGQLSPSWALSVMLACPVKRINCVSWSVPLLCPLPALCQAVACQHLVTHNSKPRLWPIFSFTHLLYGIAWSLSATVRVPWWATKEDGLGGARTKSPVKDSISMRQFAAKFCCWALVLHYSPPILLPEQLLSHCLQVRTMTNMRQDFTSSSFRMWRLKAKGNATRWAGWTKRL